MNFFSTCKYFSFSIDLGTSNCLEIPSWLFLNGNNCFCKITAYLFLPWPLQASKLPKHLLLLRRSHLLMEAVVVCSSEFLLHGCTSSVQNSTSPVWSHSTLKKKPLVFKLIMLLCLFSHSFNHMNFTWIISVARSSVHTEETFTAGLKRWHQRCPSQITTWPEGSSVSHDRAEHYDLSDIRLMF